MSGHTTTNKNRTLIYLIYLIRVMSHGDRFAYRQACGERSRTISVLFIYKRAINEN